MVASMPTKGRTIIFCFESAQKEQILRTDKEC